MRDEIRSIESTTPSADLAGGVSPSRYCTYRAKSLRVPLQCIFREPISHLH